MGGTLIFLLAIFAVSLVLKIILIILAVAKSILDDLKQG